MVWDMLNLKSKWGRWRCLKFNVDLRDECIGSGACVQRISERVAQFHARVSFLVFLLLVITFTCHVLGWL